MKYALLFPGQGSQTVGMGKDLIENSPAAKAVFDEADRALGFSLSDVILNGPEEKLTLTAYTQPALLTMSIAVLRALEEKDVKIAPACVAGHSLGEYTALVANGVLSLADGVRLVHMRGSFMQEAVPEGVGAMAAILGLEADSVRAVCEEAAQSEVCEPANFNTPVQTVISGHAAAVARAVAQAAERGAKRSVMLKVSAPFHCSLMRPVADKLAVEMDKCTWTTGSVPLIANVSASPVTDVKTIRDGLYAQTYSPVRWVESVERMAALGVQGFVELGAGKVLSGMVKKIVRKASVLNIETFADLDKFVPFAEQEAED